jgi:hypothetical protein
MTRTIAILALALAAGACRTTQPAPATTSAGGMGATTAAVAPMPSGAVRHLVVFRFKPGATPEQVRELTQAFGALRERIPGILGFEHGVNHSPENLHQGFTHVYLLTFASAAARDAYLPHPAHKAFGDLIGRLGIWEAGFVVDWTPNP